MSLFTDVKKAAELDLAARKVLAGYRLSKLAGEVEMGDGFQPFDINDDPSEVEFEPEQGEAWALRAEADQIIACGDAGWDLADARELAAEREAADREDWAESRYLIA